MKYSLIRSQIKVFNFIIGALFTFLAAPAFAGIGDLPKDSKGFTIIPANSETRIIYVSSSTGNDVNSGYSPTSPKRSLYAGYSALRNGFTDQLRLKAGDVFTDPMPNWLKGGPSENAAMSLTSYGEGARPKIVALNSDGFGSYSSGAIPQKNLIISGIEFSGGAGDPLLARVGIAIFGELIQHILIEDCAVNGFTIGIAANTSGYPGAIASDLVIRRTLLSELANLSPNTRYAGIFAGAEFARIEENALFNNTSFVPIFDSDIRGYAFHVIADRNLVGASGAANAIRDVYSADKNVLIRPTAGTTVPPNSTGTVIVTANSRRTLATYMRDLGYPVSKQTEAAFYNELRRQSKNNWRLEFTNDVVRAYLSDPTLDKAR